MKETFTLIAKAIGAGIAIGIGCMLYTLVPAPLNAFMFAIGILMVLECDLKLYTGICGSSKSAVDMALVFIANGFGITILTYLASANYNHEIANNIALAKIDTPYYVAFFGAILCGIMMEFAVSTKHRWISVMCIATFLLCGFDHSVANLFWLAKQPATLYLVGLIAIYIVGNFVGARALNFISHFERNDRVESN